MPVRRIVAKLRFRSKRLFQLSIYLTVLLGVLCLAVATKFEANSFWNLILFGLGTSLMASAVFVFLTASRDDFGNTLRYMGVESLFTNRDNALQTQDWTDLILAASKHYRVLGVANHGYMREGNAAETREALKAAAMRGVSIEILWLDPCDPRAEQREVEEGQRGTRRDAVEAMKWFWELKDSLPDPHKENLVLKTYSAIPTCGMAWVDDFVIVAYYLTGSVNRFSPGMILRKDNMAQTAILTMSVRGLGEPQLADRYIQTYEAVDRTATTIDSLNQIHELEKCIPPVAAGKVSEEELPKP